MQRIPEPELMEGREQAAAYAQADFREANTLFINLFAAAFPDFTGPTRVLDLGCGPGHILMAFAENFAGCTCLGIDGSAAMLSHGRGAAARISPSQVSLACRTLPLNNEQDQWHVILSNSLLHHLADPDHLWQSIRTVAAPGALVLVMDLLRPASSAAAAAIVAKYSGNEPEILQDDFYRSLLAAYRLDEIKDQLSAHKLPFTCRQVSDRHLAVWGRLSP
ncbi:MAG: SAM-dependent methyltransferase [Desulfobulbaceae bacterium]|nr:MAG: SAM-dependent methyltransferase [Desulfobulbaceae bacterium]